jgi:hypothetical protein
MEQIQNGCPKFGTDDWRTSKLAPRPLPLGREVLPTVVPYPLRFGKDQSNAFGEACAQLF